MYYVLTNHKLGRVLVTGKKEDLNLIKEGWVIEGQFKNWNEAYDYALKIANTFDYLLEWYFEEMITYQKQNLSKLVIQ